VKRSSLFVPSKVWAKSTALVMIGRDPAWATAEHRL
jgi:hypothetical protein